MNAITVIDNFMINILIIFIGDAIVNILIILIAINVLIIFITIFEGFVAFPIWGQATI